MLSIAALTLAALPYAAGFLAAPRGSVFLGSLNNVGDTGQYLAAIRQGMGTATSAGHLLYVDQYSSLRAAPALIYPFYTAAGMLLSPLRPPAMVVYQLLHALAAVALLSSLWRFCRAALPGASPISTIPAYALALFGGGLYAPALLLSGLARLPFAPVALTAPELSAFATLLISPHGAAGLAAELWALAGYLRWRRVGRARDLLPLALGGLALGLSYPFGVVVLVAVVGVDAMIPPHPRPLSPKGRGETSSVAGVSPPPASAGVSPPPTSAGVSPPPASGRGGWGVRVPLALALLPACGIAAYYALLFRRDPLWAASNMLRLPPPGFAVLTAAFGPLLLLALPMLWALDRRAFRGARVGFAHCSGTTGMRLVAVWAVVTPLLVLAPLPQAGRLLSGWSIALAILGAPVLMRMRPRAAIRVLAAFSFSNVMLALLYAAVAARGANPAYYAPADEERAVQWLAAHTGPGDVVMASAGSGNLVVAAAPCRVVVGQNFETFDWAAAQRDVLRFYSRSTGAAERAAIVRRRGVTWVLAGPYERALGDYVPGGPGYRLAYRNGAVRVFAVVGA